MKRSTISPLPIEIGLEKENSLKSKGREKEKLASNEKKSVPND